MNSTAVDQICFQSYTAITKAAMLNPWVTPRDAHHIFNGIAEHFERYSGECSPGPFLVWAMEMIEPATFILGLRNECRQAVRTAIGTVLARCLDLGITPWTVDEIESDLWLWALQHLDDLQTPGRASLKTRLCKRATLQARAWKTTQLRHRNRFVNVRADMVGYADGRQVTVMLPSRGDEENAAALNS